MRTPDEVLALIKSNQVAPDWIKEKRDERKVLNALVNGVDFQEVLIDRIEKIENKDKALARKKYSKDIRDLFSRVLQPRSNVFTASGGSSYNNIKSTAYLDKFNKVSKNFKGQKSVKKYLSENLFQNSDIDPNGLIFIEYYKDEKIYPTYKSINDIRNYESDGQLLKWVLFEPTKLVRGGLMLFLWRYVDEANDITFVQNGNDFLLSEERTFKHPFGVVPTFILSSLQEIGTEKRKSTINPVIELAKDYARDKSIKTVFKFTNGFPYFWMYDRFCRACQGTGKDENKACTSCSGTGQLIQRDITDIHVLDLPRDKEDAIVTPNLMGYVSPDTVTWDKYNEDLLDMEELVESTIWGTKRVKQSNTRNETATGRFIDVQPVLTELNELKDVAEWSHNFIVDMIVNWIYGSKQTKELVQVIYGDRFIIESQDVLMDKYSKARIDGSPTTILDKMLEEYIYAKFGSNETLLNQQLLKKELEPYIHYSIEQINSIFGQEAAIEKAMFTDFWEQADLTKSKEELNKDFINYKNTQKNGKNTDGNS